MQKKNVSVIGLGKLGACYAAFLANRGLNVVGVDVNKRTVDSLNKGIAPVPEPDLQKYITKNRNRLRATLDFADAIKRSNTSFIIIPTPSQKDGAFSMAFAKTACEKIGVALKDKSSYHLVCMVSTVLPEDSRKELIPVIEKASKKKCGPDFGYCYSPSLIALGEIIKNLENPDFLFLGAYDKKAEDTLAEIYKHVYPAISPERMSIESAEIAKIALNSYVTMKITFANFLGMLCEDIDHASASEVTAAIGKDRRIGKYYLGAGLGYGGPCFPRDNFAFANAAKKRKLGAPLAIHTHSLNKSISDFFIKKTHSFAAKQDVKNIGFLGVSYKPGTPIAEESQAVYIAKALKKKGYNIHIYESDTAEAKKIFGKHASYQTSLLELIKKSDIIFISNRDKAFSVLPQMLSRSEKSFVVIDPWAMFQDKEFDDRVTYAVFGRGSFK